MSILIKDNQTGNIHEYGTNEHDALHISGDGSCLYYENMQNGDGLSAELRWCISRRTR